MKIGYTMMCEQRSPKDLVDDIVLAEQAGFPFSVISDHYHPWLESQGHGGYAWSVLGAAAVKTQNIGLMTYVTCPIIRYHPAVVAQKAATVAVLSDGRFRLGLGAGESLNEHVIGQGWPPVNTRHAMLREAIEIIRKLHGGGYVSYRGEHYDVDSARIFDLPDGPIEIGLAVSGRQSCRMAGELADIVISTEPKAELIDMFGEFGGAGKPAVGQLGVCYGTDTAAAAKLAHDQFRWFGLGWKVNPELPSPVNFAAATAYVREDDVASAIPHGPDLEPYVESIQAFRDAGFTELALVQIGSEQKAFCEWYATELRPALDRAGI